MKTETFREVIFARKPPLNLYTSDGRVIYVDHPESVLVSESLIAIGSARDAETGRAKEIVLLNPDHIVRIEPTKRKPLHNVA